MNPPEVYEDLDGQTICLGHLDSEERKLLNRIRKRAQTHPDWNDFYNYHTRQLTKFYGARNVPPHVVIKGVVYRVAQDLSSRLGLAGGWIRPDDYESELESLIENKFASQRAFCEATGLSEDMLSHVLAGRKDLSLAKLTEALSRIGYRLRIVPAPEIALKRKRKRTG